MSLCLKTRGRHDLVRIPPQAHPAAPFLNNLRLHGADVALTRNPSKTHLAKQLAYGCHPSARAKAHFFRADIVDQIQAGHLLALPLSAVRHLPHLWISPSAVIPQDARRDRPIYDYSKSGLNEAVLRTAPPEALQFGRTLPRITKAIVEADPRLRPVWMSKNGPLQRIHESVAPSRRHPKTSLCDSTPPRGHRTPHRLPPLHPNGLRRER